MLRALRGENVERPPVWMMRQAGRYMKVRMASLFKRLHFEQLMTVVGTPLTASCDAAGLPGAVQKAQDLQGAVRKCRPRSELKCCPLHGQALHSSVPSSLRVAIQSRKGLTPLIRPPSQVEISLQPWEAFRPDGVILFSDILTPLSGMNIPFDIVQGKGPIIADPIRTMEVSPCSLACSAKSAVARQLWAQCHA